MNKLLAALLNGPIRNIGGIVYDKNMNPIMSVSAMIQPLEQLKRDLSKIGVRIERIDAGGSPTWDLVKD